ncbi:MAG: hypothetical protein RR614_16345 [Eubacterium sp.]
MPDIRPIKDLALADLYRKLAEGEADITKGRTADAETVFSNLRKKYHYGE